MNEKLISVDVKTKKNALDTAEKNLEDAKTTIIC